MRQIDIDGTIWKYRIGKMFCVAKRVDSNEGRKVLLSTLTGLSAADVERGQWKRWFSVTPKHVADWLRRTNITRV